MWLQNFEEEIQPKKKWKNKIKRKNSRATRWQGESKYAKRRFRKILPMLMNFSKQEAKTKWLWWWSSIFETIDSYNEIKDERDGFWVNQGSW